jgi:hypothetical protein
LINALKAHEQQAFDRIVNDSTKMVNSSLNVLSGETYTQQFLLAAESDGSSSVASNSPNRRKLK